MIGVRPRASVGTRVPLPLGLGVSRSRPVRLGARRKAACGHGERQTGTRWDSLHLRPTLGELRDKQAPFPTERRTYPARDSERLRGDLGELGWLQARVPSLANRVGRRWANRVHPAPDLQSIIST